MAMSQHIRNPVEWSLDQLRNAERAVGSTGRALHGAEETGREPVIRRIGITDLRSALAQGVGDLAANRSDVLFICLVYPLAGLLLMYLAFGYDMLPLIAPLAFAFALIGPAAAVGLYEMSRRREQGREVSWADSFGVMRSPAFGEILVLALLLLAIAGLWLAVAATIYAQTLGPEPPASLESFVRDALTTGEGWAMILLGCGVGLLFALVVLMISVVSFPLLLDRHVGLLTAVRTSARAVLANPRAMLTWGAIVAAGLALGSAPLLLGLIFVMPILGHATWHLYRKVVA
jgi:uncharacterized membrane protein